MKILLIGEFSNVHRNLADGLKILGHDVTIASTGDGFKQIKYDIKYLNANNKSGIVASFKNKFKTIFDYYKNYRTFSKNDIVQLINPIFYAHNNPIENILAFNIFKNTNNKVFLGAFGDDYYYIDACLKGDFRYDMISENIRNHTPDDHLVNAFFQYYTPNSKLLTNYIASKVDGIIAGLYEYYKPYLNTQFSKKLIYIAFPINTDEIEYFENNNKRIKFLVGIQSGRENWKGINIILPILKDLRQKYSQDIEILESRSIPYKEYIKLYKTSDVVVDQLYSYSPAINALNAMAAGKVVLSGGEKEYFTLLKADKTPGLINIIPDREQIKESILQLIENKHKLRDYGISNRNFIEKFHDYKFVAKKYLDEWQKT